jgi:hypothetical protein
MESTTEATAEPVNSVEPLKSVEQLLDDHTLDVNQVSGGGGAAWNAWDDGWSNRWGRWWDWGNAHNT